jgi:hypothetical protein
MQLLRPGQVDVAPPYVGGDGLIASPLALTGAFSKGFPVGKQIWKLTPKRPVVITSSLRPPICVVRPLNSG